jgi:phosphatidylglycerophosphate synthase
LLWTVLGSATASGVILLAATFHTIHVAGLAGSLWLLWYAATVFLLFTHLGMVDDDTGRAHERLLLPNGLSFLRLGLAPLVMWPCLSLPTHPATAPVFAAFLVALALSDTVDGFIARRFKRETRMGRMLDPIADMALATFLAIGLLEAGMLPVPLFVLIMVRYPGSLLGVVVLYFAQGPMPIRPTAVVRATALASNIVLIGTALALLLQPEWLTTSWFEWWLQTLYVVLVVNLLHLVRRAVGWERILQDVAP